MANADVVAYNIAAYIATLFLLKFGADNSSTTLLSSLAAPAFPKPSLALLLLEESGKRFLAVVIASLARNCASLAIGNIVGSAISNILGAFSLGLLFHDKDKPIQFDRSSRIYSLVLLVLTTFDSDSDDSSDGESTIDVVAERTPDHADGNNHKPNGPVRVEWNEQTNQAVHAGSSATQISPGLSRRKRCTLRYHLSYLLLDFLAICLAGYVLSHAATTITDEFGISDVLFGVVILAIATTLPEKFVAVMSGHRGHASILAANTAGSNIFLLALCSGVVMLDTEGRFEHGNVNIPELGVMWGSTVAFTATVWFG
ncbi:hypothetical protein IQ07DRAFT_638636 [Pyrenochaeta sp. DS3sAY3a]|nr:hypothetical protein IQ07DRAFT_638636 [Pyrenochaeta sp. DS3sAY3a]